MWFLKRISKNYKQQKLSLSLPHSPELPQLLCYSKQYYSIWFEFESGRRIDLSSNIVIEDPLGLYEFLRFRGQGMIDKQLQNKPKALSQYHQSIIFYEKDYRNWRL